MNYSILIVDDEPDNFEVIEALLANQKYTLHYANRGEDAIATLDDFNPDAILLDVMMPGIDGIEVCKRIKAIPQYQSIPIIMVTALTETADLARCIEAGADDFISKPINGIELRSRLQSMLRIKKQHDRIQSLSKLQRNNIHFLENSLHELHLDLAVSFPNELNAPLQSMLGNVRLLQHNFKQMQATEVEEMLDVVNHSTMKLDKLTQSFLFYLQLSLPSKNTQKQETCDAKFIIEQTVSAHTGLFGTSQNIAFNLETAELAVAANHMQYIIGELFDRAIEDFKYADRIGIFGKIIDNNFHLCIDNVPNSQNNFDAKLAEVLQFHSELNSDRELGIGLKIVKKIVEIYDGLFLMVNTDRHETAIYLTLPLAIVK